MPHATGRQARTTRPPRQLGWRIELDYRQLYVDHYGARCSLGWCHRTALVTAARGVLTLERRNPSHPLPA